MSSRLGQTAHQQDGDLMRTARSRILLPVLLSSSALAACAGGPSALPALPGTAPTSELPKLTVGSIGIEPSVVQVGSTEAYSRIARGANTCWFGARGRLAGTHIFYADAAPSAQGGSVEIVVHERAVNQPKPWGFKALRIVLKEGTAFDGSSGGNTTISVENARLSDEEAARMRKEVYRWAAGIEGCLPDPAIRAISNPASPARPAARPATAPR
jgi:hypothetical protein